MTTYRTRPVEVQAVQWWKHGDHPRVHATSIPNRDHFEFYKGNGHWVEVREGDWIVTHHNGTVEHVPQADFAGRFEEVK